MLTQHTHWSPGHFSSSHQTIFWSSLNFSHTGYLIGILYYVVKKFDKNNLELIKLSR